jgi:DNA polymerase III delta subunit
VRAIQESREQVADTLFDTLTSHDREQLQRILSSLVADGEDPHSRGRRS